MNKRSATNRYVGGWFAALACLGIASSAAAEEGQWGEPIIPPRLEITGMQYGGELCPPGAIADVARAIQSRTSARISLDNLVLETTDEQVKKGCQLTFDVEVQKGYQYGFSEFQVEGKPTLTNSYSTLALQYGIDTDSLDDRRPAEQAWSHVTGDAQQSQSLGARLRAWSPTCGASQKFKLQFWLEATVAPNANAPEGAVTRAKLALDHFYLFMGVVNDSAWRRCDGEPVYPVR
ncbi:MAG: DUF4360 domain-containing protein [Polyangiales bacterium]